MIQSLSGLSSCNGPLKRGSTILLPTMCLTCYPIPLLIRQHKFLQDNLFRFFNNFTASDIKIDSRC